MGGVVKFTLSDKGRFKRYLQLNNKREPRDPEVYERELEAWLSSGEADRSRRPPQKMKISDIKRSELEL